MNRPKPGNSKIERLHSRNESQSLPSRYRFYALATVRFLMFLAGTNAFGQGTAFTYQGQLQNNGGLVNGNYNLQFSLYTSKGRVE